MCPRAGPTLPVCPGRCLIAAAETVDHAADDGADAAGEPVDAVAYEDDEGDDGGYDPSDLTPVPWAATTAGAAWFAVTAAVLCGISPLLLIASTPAVEDTSPVWVGALLLTVGAGLRYAWLVGLGERRMQELIFWLFTYVFLGLAPLAQLRSAQYPGTTPDLDLQLHGPAMWIAVTGSLAFGAGVAVAGRRPRPERPSSVGDVRVHRLVILSTVALLAAAFYVSQVGVGVLFSSRAERNAVEAALWPDDTVRAIIKAASSLPLVVSLVALLRLRAQRRAAGGKGPSVLPWTVLGALVLVVNPISSPRYVVGTAALAVLAAFGISATPKRTRLFAVLLAAGLVLVFPYADVTRRADRSDDLQAGPAQSLASSDFDAFAQLNNTVAYVRDNGTAEGGQLAGAVLFFVPRSIWEGKPRDTGIVLADYRGYRFDNLSAPLVGEFFINGGWFLLIAGMGALGYGVRQLDARNLATPGKAVGSSTLTTILPFYSIIVLRGSLLQSMAGLSVLVTCAVFVTRPSGPALDRTRLVGVWRPKRPLS